MSFTFLSFNSSITTSRRFIGGGVRRGGGLRESEIGEIGPVPGPIGPIPGPLPGAGFAGRRESSAFQAQAFKPKPNLKPIVKPNR